MTGGGAPNPGWWRSGNGEWYPPEHLPQGWSVGPDGVPRSFEFPPTVPVMAAPSAWDRVAEGYRLWPNWAQVVVPIAAFLFAGAAAAVLGNDGDLDAMAATRRQATTNSTVPSTTLHAPPAPVSVNGLVIVGPPTLSATNAPQTTNAPAVSATTTRFTSVAPTSTTPVSAPAPSTVPPTVGATTTAPTTTAPAISSSTTTVPTTTVSTTTGPTSTAPPTTAPTTTRVTTTAPTTTRVTTTASPTTRAVTHTVAGTVLVDARMSVVGPCAGSGRLASFENGQSIVLADSSGRVVGEGVLNGCRWTDGRLSSGSFTAKPEFTFTIASVAEIASYTPRVAWKTWPTVTLTALRNGGWSLRLEVQ